jgi:hypothetical protein
MAVLTHDGTRLQHLEPVAGRSVRPKSVGEGEQRGQQRKREGEAEEQAPGELLLQATAVQPRTGASGAVRKGRSEEKPWAASLCSGHWLSMGERWGPRRESVVIYFERVGEVKREPSCEPDVWRGASFPPTNPCPR